MSHQEINISAHTNEEGIVSLNIPTGIIDRDIQLKVSFEVIEQATLSAQTVVVSSIAASSINCLITSASVEIIPA